MKILNPGDTYRYLGFILTITIRVEDIVMAENPEYGIEVFKIQSRKSVKFPNGSFSEAGEFPPSNSQWGINSGHWPLKHRKLALKYFERLVSKGKSYPKETLKALCLKK